MRYSIWVLAGLLLVTTGCKEKSGAPLALAGPVDIARFMGDWYVIASIPTAIERDAYNAVESYRLAPDGTVETTFTFRAGSFDGRLKRYTPKGFVREGTGNAVWGMQFVWPFKADYRISYLDPEYTQTVVGREQRDYVWIMARKPTLPEDDYRRILEFLVAQGYDVALIRKVPQRWSAP